MYESVFACRDGLRRRGRYWLRLYGQPDNAVAIVSEVRGNLGPSVTRAVSHIALALVRCFELDPHALVFIEHWPCDSFLGEGGKETFDLVTLRWRESRYGPAEWTSLNCEEVNCRVGTPFLFERPFWRPASRDWYTCTVGAREATVGRVAVEEWEAVVNENSVEVSAEHGFPTRNHAMRWALDALANLAAEFDTLPLEMRK